MDYQCFNTCSSCEEQPGCHHIQQRRVQVSIHAPLARSNFRLHISVIYHNLFQYMLLLRGATFIPPNFSSNIPVSIHAPLARSNTIGSIGNKMKIVSIHAPLARSNVKASIVTHHHSVSIHAPLARSNRRFVKMSSAPTSFNTCSSCEEQLGTGKIVHQFFGFNTCSSCEEQQG